MATASPYDAALGDVVHRLRQATAALDRADNDADLARTGAELSLRLSQSSYAAIGLGASPDRVEQVYWCVADGTPQLSETTATELVAVAETGKRNQATFNGRFAAIGVQLRAGGQLAGSIAVARTMAYSDAEKAALEIFAAHLARAIDGAGLRQRQYSHEAALIELRKRLDQHEARESMTAERLRVAERVERAHELAVQVLMAVSAHAGSGRNLNDFYHRLGETVGELVGAGKVLFWRLKDGNVLSPLAGGYGISDAFLSRISPTRCDPEGEDLASRVVFKDLIFRANQASEAGEFAYVLERLGVQSAMSVPWRAGQDRLGLVAAYDSNRRGGFSREDTWVLQKAGLAAGLVTQLWHAQEDLKRSVDRLQKVDSARQMLLKNMTTVVEKERKRFVSELHDDALQKLTAAEMHLARLSPQGGVEAASVSVVTELLEQTEAALRRLVFEVHPPALEGPGGLAQSIRDRLSMLALAGINHELEVDVPQDLSIDLKALMFRQISEAIGNVERHSKAAAVKVSLTKVDGGVLGVVEDNGQGFEVAERSNLPGHLGLLALKERTLMAGGRYRIDSHPGAGTRVEFWLPLNP